MQLTAKLSALLPLQTGEGKNGPWKKQDVIFETDGQYPKKVCISFWGDKIIESMLQVGNMLTISFDIESREYNGRWYTDCKAWKIEAGAGSSAAPQRREAPKQQYQSSAAPAPQEASDVKDDLPF